MIGSNLIRSICFIKWKLPHGKDSNYIKGPNQSTDIHLTFISLNSFSANVKFYNISDIYGITSGEAFSVCKDQYGFIWASTKTGVLRVTEGDCRNYELPCKTTDFVFVKLTYGNSQLFSYTNNSQIFHYDEVTDRFLFWQTYGKKPATVTSP